MPSGGGKRRAGPAHPGETAEFHRLEVRLDTGRSCPGCSIQARTDNDIPFDLVPFSVRTEAEADAGGETRIRVDLEISTAGMTHVASVDGRSERLIVYILYTDERDRLLGQEWKIVRETVPLKLLSTIPVTIMIPLKQPKQNLKVIVYEAKAHLSKLIAEVVRTGKPITICHNREPVVDQNVAETDHVLEPAGGAGDGGRASLSPRDARHGKPAPACRPIGSMDRPAGRVIVNRGGSNDSSK